MSKITVVGVVTDIVDIPEEMSTEEAIMTDSQGQANEITAFSCNEIKIELTEEELNGVTGGIDDGTIKANKPRKYGRG